MLKTSSIVAMAGLFAACGGPPSQPPAQAPAREPAPAAPSTSGATTGATDATGASDAGSVATAAGDASAASPPARACAPIAASFSEPVAFSRGVVTSAVPHVVGEGPALTAFHEKLARVARGGSTEKVRVAFYGDSQMTRDFISGAFRRALQARFGDAGHGFVAAARPWGWYEHMDIRHDVTPKEDTPWGIFAASGRQLGDKIYGFANIAAETSRGGATTWVATAYGAASPVGKTAGSAEIFYLKRPGGGGFNVLVDGAKVEEVSTENETVEPASVRVKFPDGPHKVEAVVKGGHAVRIFGTALERENAGVVVDSLGAGALNFELLAHVDSPTRIAQLRDRKYDLVIFLLGTNLLGAGSQRKWVTAVLDDFKKALPDTALMLMSPPDQGMSHTDSSSNPAVARLAKDLKETADAEHVLFWDFYEGMGGKGAIRAFVRTGLGEPDCVHLGFSGASLMGTRFAAEIVRGWKAHVDATPDAGCK